MYNNTVISNCQEVLIDRGRNGRIRPWARHKLSNGYLALAYDDIDVNKARRLRDCASWLEFERGDDGMRLHNANFCRVRLCPICAWRRSLKTYAQVSSVVDAMQNRYSYVFMTLTCRNCTGNDLSDTITHLLKSLDRLAKRKCWQQAYKGFFRGLEVTHNTLDDTYHPHLHLLLAVNKSYFSSRYYISQERLTELWQQALRADYTPITDVRRIYGTGAKAIAEVAKYSTKASDIICIDDWDLTVDTVRVLDSALANRRLTGWYGVFKDYHKQLHLDDNDDGDLVHTEADINNADDDTTRIVYTWHTGYSQYIKS